MLRSTLRLAFAALALAAVQAQAAPSGATIRFTGVVSTSEGANIVAPAVGETISGAFTLSAFAGHVVTSTDGSTTWTATGQDPGGPLPLMVTGSATFSGGQVLAFSPAPWDQSFQEAVDRGAVHGSNLVNVLADSFAPGNAGLTSLHIELIQPGTAATSLFGDPAGGLSLFQPLDLSADGLAVIASFQDATAVGTDDGTFRLTSLTISAVQEPGEMELMLVGLGLVGMAARRRRSRAEAPRF